MSAYFEFGEVRAKIRDQILEMTSALTSPYFRHMLWVKDKIDPSDLARKRRVEGKTLDQIATKSGHGRSAVVK